MNPRYQAYLEEVEERKRQGLPPPPYIVTPDGKMSFEQFRPGQDLGMVDPTHPSGAVRLGAPGALYTPSQAEQTFVNQQRPSTDPNDYPANIPGTSDWMRNMTFDLRRGRRDRELSNWRQEQRQLRAGPLPTKKKVVITQEDGKPTKKVTTETEDDKGERTQHDIMMEQFADHAAGTVDLASLPFISDADAAGKGLTKKQDESGMWWWIDSIGNFIGRVIEGGLAGQGEAWKHKAEAETQQAEAVAEGIGSLFDTTAEREARKRQAKWEEGRPMQDYQGALAGLIGQTPTGQMGSGEALPGSAAWSTVSPSGEFIQRGPPASMPEGFMTPAREQEVAEQAIEDRIWGNYKYDVDAAEEQYKADMAEIYKKAMQLSMFDIDPSAFVELATKRMEQTSAFSEQRRLQKIQRGIYYTEDGKWDPPSSKRVAFNRAKRFGAGVKLASAIADYDPGKEKKTGAMQSFYKFIEGTGWTTETVRSGSDRADELAAQGYTVDRPYVDRENKSVDASLMRRMNDALEVGNIGAAIQAYVERHTVKYDQMAGGVNVAKIRAAAGDIVWDRLKYRYKDKVEMTDEMPPSDPEKLRLWEEDLRKRGILYLRLPDGTIVDVVD